jgi:hypothetical protein
MMLSSGVPYSDSCSEMPQAMLGYVEEVEREAKYAEGDNSAWLLVLHLLLPCCSAAVDCAATLVQLSAFRCQEKQKVLVGPGTVLPCSICLVHGPQTDIDLVRRTGTG